MAVIDHGFCRSVYTLDPDGTMVEFCQSLRELNADDHAEALALLEAETPEMKTPPEADFIRGDQSVTPPWAKEPATSH